MQNMTQTWTLEKFFARIYAVMAMGVGVSAVVSFMTLAFFPENLRFFGNGAIIAVLLIQVALVMALNGMAAKNSPMALPAFILFSAVNGFTISFTLAFYNITTVFQAFVTSAIMFALLAVFGARTKKNLTAFGQAAQAALWGIIIALLLNAFIFRSGAVGIAVSFITVLVFAVLIAWDNQRIRQTYVQTNGQVAEGWAIMMGLRLYLDFINLFLSILRIFGLMGGNNSRNRF
jgi:uncharacterized protein